MDIKTAFLTALEEESDEARQTYLDTACGNNSDLRQQVERLLEAHDNAKGFLDPEAFGSDVLAQSPFSNSSEAVIDRYTLLKKIGEGGMAIVYLAEQTHPIRRQVALKVIKLGMDTAEVIARFEIERQALALMDHPSIAKVLDAGVTEAGKPYFVMELVRGIGITEYCDTNELNTTARLELFATVCEAVHHAHQKGIIHRDLKPSNILVALRDNMPVPMIIDFGIAKATHQRLTEKTLFTLHTQLMGTPEYMSPEQAEMSDTDIDIRTDIYSLGVVLYELLAGTSPFDATTLRRAAFGEIQRIIREEEPLRPSTRISAMGNAAEEIAARRGTNVAELTKRLNRELEWIPMKAMRKDRTRRYRSASEFSDDIGNYLSDRPLLAGPESTVYRFRKAIQKHHTRVIAITMVATILIIGSIISSSLYVRMHHALDRVSQLESLAEVDIKLFPVQILHEKGQYQAALEKLEALLEAQDLGDKALLLRAHLRIELGQLQLAEDELLQLAQAPPQIAGTAHYMLARVYLMTNPAKADKHKQLADSMDPQDAEGYYLRGMAAASADDALTWLSGAVELDHTHYAARKARTFALYNLRMYQDMANDADILIETRPHDHMGHALRAIAHREMSDFEQAVTDHAQAIELCSMPDELPRLHEQRRVTYMQSGHYREALEDAKQVAALTGEKFNYSVFYALLGLEAYDKVEAEYKNIATLGERPVRFFKSNAEKHLFEILRTGQPFTLPPDIVSRSPFYFMEQATELYTRLARMKAKPLHIPGGLWLEDWSPDGQTIVYNQFRAFSWLPGTLEKIRSRSVEIMNLASGKTRQIAPSGYNLTLSPDSKNIAFQDAPYGDSAIWLAPLAGGPALRVTPGSRPNWSRDSQHIFFRAENKTLCSKSINEPDAPPVTVMETQAGGHFGSFSISPDESLIAFEESSEILVLTFPEGKEVVRWKLPWPTQSWSMQLQWHPNGTTVVFNSTSQYNQMGMCLFDVDTDKVAHVLNITRPWCRSFWSPDASQLIIQPYSHEYAWRLDIDPTIPLTEALAPALTTKDFLTQRLTQWNQRIEADPLYADNYVSRAVVSMAMKDFDNAAQDLNQCSTLVTESNDPAINAIIYWAWMYPRTGRTTEAQCWALCQTQLAERFPEAFKSLIE